MRIADPGDLKLWDNYVRNRFDATPYHLSAWNTSINAAYGHQTFNLIAESDKYICGVLPLCIIKPPLLTGTLCSLPYCDLAGILADNKETRTRLLNKALGVSRDLGIHYLTIRERSSNEYDVISNTENMKNHKVSMMLDLPETSDILLKTFKSKLRSQIKKAEKNGLTFRYGREDCYLKGFYNVFSQNMKNLGSPTHSYSWFEEIRRHYSNDIIIGIVNIGDKVVAGGILLTLNNITVVPWASTLASYNRLSPNMLLYWNFLKYACDRGCKQFDFGRSSYGEGTYKFKQQWGAKPIPLSWKKYDSTGSVLTNEITSYFSLRPIAESIWRRLPLVLANSIGPLARKYISL